MGVPLAFCVMCMCAIQTRGHALYTHCYAAYIVDDFLFLLFLVLSLVEGVLQEE